MMAETSRPIRILTADDHPVLRDGLAAIIEAQDDMEIVGEAATGQEVIERHRLLQPDVTLMDIQMPDLGGIDAIVAIRRESPRARVIVLTTYDGDVPAMKAIRAGAAGYLLKSSVRRELVDVIRAVHAGRRYILASVAQEIALHSAEDPLSERELDVLKLIAEGNANKEIAWQLCVSEDTIKAHIKGIFGKLGASDRTHAVTIAMRRGFLNV